MACSIGAAGAAGAMASDAHPASAIANATNSKGRSFLMTGSLWLGVPALNRYRPRRWERENPNARLASDGNKTLRPHRRSARSRHRVDDGLPLLLRPRPFRLAAAGLLS